MPYIGKPQSADPITVNSSNITDASIANADLSPELTSSISGSLGANASVIRTLDRTTISGSIPQALATTSSPTFAAGTITGDLSVGGTLTAQEIHTEFESASIIFTSGSTRFGDTSDDVHNMTGSLNVSGAINLNDGDLSVIDSVGIGTNNPTVALEVFGSADQQIRIDSTGNRAQLQFDGKKTSDAEFAEINFANDGDSAAAIHAMRDGANDAARLAFMTQATGGGVTERMSIDSTGNVGIGTNAPIGGGLDILGDEEALVVRTGDSGRVGVVLKNTGTGTDVNFTDGLIIKLDSDESGFIGLGADNPSKLLHLGAANTNVLAISGSGMVGIGTNTTNNTDILYVTDGASGYAGANRMVQLKRDTTNGNDTTSFCSMLFGNNSNGFTIGYGGTTDRFRFIDGGGVERFTIVNGGNVGIGTTTPDYILDVESTGTTFMRLLSTNTNGVAGLYMENDTVKWYIDTHGGVNDSFLIGEENVVGGTALSITTANSVGIGTQTPVSGGLHIHTDASTEGIYLKSEGATRNNLVFDSNISSAADNIGFIDANWDETNVARISMFTGTDTSNKDDGRIGFATAAAGSVSERMRIDETGAVLFNTTTRTSTGNGGATFDPNSVGRAVLNLGSVNYTSELDLVRLFNDNGEVGDIRTNGSGASFNSNSDYRLKENQVTLSNALTRLNNLKPYRFNFKADPSTTLDGFFAHEVQEVVPEAVTGTKDQMMPIQYQPGDDIPEGKEVYDIKEYSTTEIDAQKMDASKLVPLLVAALQEADDKIDALTTRIEVLEG
tara:strand:- start:228 stop:2579 length:2352 start_codon:yes stop_codon:yes gene_type:complete